MDRRKSLKLIVTGAVAAPIAIAGCKTDDKKAKGAVADDPQFTIDRNPDELKYEKELLAKEKFFTPHEFATITAVSYTHLRAHETVLDLVCRLLLEKTKQQHYNIISHITSIKKEHH